MEFEKEREEQESKYKIQFVGDNSVAILNEDKILKYEDHAEKFKQTKRKGLSNAIKIAENYLLTGKYLFDSIHENLGKSKRKYRKNKNNGNEGACDGEKHECFIKMNKKRINSETHKLERSLINLDTTQYSKYNTKIFNIISKDSFSQNLHKDIDFLKKILNRLLKFRPCTMSIYQSKIMGTLNKLNEMCEKDEKLKELTDLIDECLTKWKQFIMEDFFTPSFVILPKSQKTSSDKKTQDDLNFPSPIKPQKKHYKFENKEEKIQSKNLIKKNASVVLSALSRLISDVTLYRELI